MNEVDINKQDIIVEIIKNYKFHPEWDYIYVTNEYDVAISYMMQNWDRLFKLNKDSAIQSKRVGDRSVTYKSGINNIIKSDLILKSLLGLPCLRMS